MKSILYIGATLMIGASVYGFVDYRQTHDKKEFKEMYSEKKATVPVVEPVKTEIKKDEPVKTVAVVTTKPVTTKKKVVAKKETLEPVAPIAEEDKLTTTEKELWNENLDRPVPAKEETKIVKKKKIRKEFFSRGRMRDEVVLEEPVSKKEITEKKTESKEL